MAPDSALKRLAQLGRKDGAWLVALIEGAQASEGEGRRDPGFFHPSDLGAECDAYLAFKYLGAPARQVISAQLQRIFDYGHHREGYLQQYTKASGISLVSQIDPDLSGGLTRGSLDRYIEIPNLHIRGELDNWVINPVSKELFVIDYKTMRSGLWEKLDTVVHAHHLQVHPYMLAKDTYKAFIVYENKNTQELKALPADWDFKMWAGIVDRLERILEGLDRDVVFRTPKNCAGCPFGSENGSGICLANRISELKVASGLYK